MSEVRDPKIKLFGKTIEQPGISVAAAVKAAETGGASSAQPCEASGEDCSNQDPPSSSDSIMLEDRNFNGDTEDQESEKNLTDPRKTDSKEENRANPMTSVELDDCIANPPPMKNDSMTMNCEEDQTEEKSLKKPDKIVPCPRCNSMNTKFCYFNNYNVNQPRHFCKNCQRYWTAGGTMRNVPVGAGRRKNKNAATLHGLPNGTHHPAVLNPNSNILAFSSDTSLCESMTSVLNIHQPEGVEKGDDNSSRSSVTNTSSKDEVGKFSEPVTNFHPFPMQVPVFPGGPWPYPWNPIPWSSPVGPSTFPPPFPYWGCAIPGTWNIPWIIPSVAPSSKPNSPTLGKHSRDDDVSRKGEKMRKESNPEKCLWVPKTLRIDDPGEAAKSSIWATLGIKNDRADSIGGGHGLFKAFRSQSDGDEKTHVIETSTVLQANPAALSRSLRFHESS